MSDVAKATSVVEQSFNRKKGITPLVLLLVLRTPVRIFGQHLQSCQGIRQAFGDVLRNRRARAKLRLSKHLALGQKPHVDHEGGLPQYLRVGRILRLLVCLGETAGGLGSRRLRFGCFRAGGRLTGLGFGAGIVGHDW